MRTSQVVLRERCDCSGAVTRRCRFLPGATATRELGIPPIARVARLVAVCGLLVALQVPLALAQAPHPTNDAGSRAKQTGAVRSEAARLVTGSPVHLQSVVAADPPTGIIAISPVPAKTGSYPLGTTIEKRCAGGTNDGLVCTVPADCPPAGVGVCLGKKLSTASSEGFRAFFDVTVSSWDPQQPNDGPYVHTVQVKVGAGGYMNGVGANLAPPVIACTNDAPGNTLCRTAFGEDWAKCELLTCKPGYVDKSGTKRAAENWCAPDGCNQGDVDTSTPYYRFFTIAETSQLDRHYAHYVGSLVLDIPGKESVDGPAKGVYTVNPRSAETHLDDGSVDIPTLQENGFIVEIKLGSCCHHLGTPDAGCIDTLLSNECENPANAPYFWEAMTGAPGVGVCDAPPGSEGCKQCLTPGTTDPLCNDNDACTIDTCTPIGTCVYSSISVFNPNKPAGTMCCDKASGTLTLKDDFDACTRDSCSGADNRGSAVHDPVAALGDPCDDGNPATVFDQCDGVRSQANGGCVGTPAKPKDLAAWQGGAYNCLNYAANRKNVFSAQPKIPAGVPAFTCANVAGSTALRAAAWLGLAGARPGGWPAGQCLAGEYLVALVVAPPKLHLRPNNKLALFEGDYHFYRLNANGNFTHKRGLTPAQTLDAGIPGPLGRPPLPMPAAGVGANPPDSAARGQYTDFCGYYCMPNPPAPMPGAFLNTPLPDLTGRVLRSWEIRKAGALDIFIDILDIVETLRHLPSRRNVASTEVPPPDWPDYDLGNFAGFALVKGPDAPSEFPPFLRVFKGVVAWYSDFEGDEDTVITYYEDDNGLEEYLASLFAPSGACCDRDPFDGCEDDVLETDCACEKCEWFEDSSCAEIECLHNPIPTVSEWGLVVLTLLLLIGAKIYFARRQTATAS